MPRPIRMRATDRRWAGAGTWLRVIAALALAGGAFAGCGILGQGCDSMAGQAACTHGPTGAPGGLSREAAVAAARRLAPAAGADPTLTWAAIEPDPFAPQGTVDARLVWEVQLHGTFVAPPCPSGPRDVAPSTADKACVDGEGGLIVVLDYFSGAFLGWLH